MSNNKTTLRTTTSRAPATATAPAPAPRSSAVTADVERQTAEVQAAMTIAQRFPRDLELARARIAEQCAIPAVAEHALYSYQRGGSAVTGPSIRLAELLMQCVGNLEAGVRELERGVDATGVPYAEIEAYAWDYQSNARDRKTFRVPLVRRTRAGSTMLDDPRDIYEHVANQGARRKRACILAVLPAWIVDEATEHCRHTMSQSVAITADTIAALVRAFGELRVSRAQLERHIGYTLAADTLRRADYARLRSIYRSIADGMAQPADFFGADAPAALPADDDDAATTSSATTSSATGATAALPF